MHRTDAGADKWTVVPDGGGSTSWCWLGEDESPQGQLLNFDDAVERWHFRTQTFSKELKLRRKKQQWFFFPLWKAICVQQKVLYASQTNPYMSSLWRKHQGTINSYIFTSCYMLSNSWMCSLKARIKSTTSHYTDETALRTTEWMKSSFRLMQTAVSQQSWLSVLPQNIFLPSLFVSMPSFMKHFCLFLCEKKKKMPGQRGSWGVWHEVSVVKGNVSGIRLTAPSMSQSMHHLW